MGKPLGTSEQQGPFTATYEGHVEGYVMRGPSGFRYSRLGMCRYALEDLAAALNESFGAVLTEPAVIDQRARRAPV